MKFRAWIFLAIAFLGCVAFAANQFNVNVYVGGKFQSQWAPMAIPPINSVIDFDFPRLNGPVIIDSQVWHSDASNTVDIFCTEAIYKNGSYVRLTNQPPVTLTNWFDTILISSTNAYQFMTNVTQWCTNVINKSGNVYALRIGLGNVLNNGTALKMALYSDTNTLVTYGSATINISDSYKIKTVSVSPRFVHAGTNIIAFSLNVGGNNTVAIRSPGLSWAKVSQTYPSFPPATLYGYVTNSSSLTYYLGEDVQ